MAIVIHLVVVEVGKVMIRSVKPEIVLPPETARNNTENDVEKGKTANAV